MEQKKQTRLAHAALLLVAVIWGSGFIATEYAIRSEMTTAMIMTVRFCIAALLMLPLCAGRLRTLGRRSVLLGLGAGTLLFLGFFVQTLGQSKTSVSNSAFLTATNVVMVPFLVWAISRKRPPVKIFVLALTTLFGIGLLTIRPDVGLRLNPGDLLVLLCALIFALHIAFLGLFCREIDVKALTFLQFAASGILSIGSLLFSGNLAAQLPALRAGFAPVLYLALFSTCVCYFLQTWAQQRTTPGKTGIILCCEGLFGSLFSVLLGMEPVTAGLVVGGLIIFTSVLLSEADFGFLKKGEKKQLTEAGAADSESAG